MRQRRHSVLMQSVLVAVLSQAAIEVAAQSYVLTDLGTLGGHNSYATGINTSGQVVGYSAPSGYNPNYGFLYSGGSMINLGDLNGDFGAGGNSMAFGINDAGTVVGIAYAGYYNSAFSYSGGTMSNIGNGGSSGAYGLAISSSGAIVGYVAGGINDIAAVVVGGAITDMGLNSAPSRANGINDSGQIVGSMTVGGLTRAFLYSGGNLTNLGVLGGASTASWAYGINNAGVIVGVAVTAAGGVLHPMVYSGGVMTDLGTLFPASSGSANAINNNGDIVGGFGSYAFFDHNGIMTDLNSVTALPSGWHLQSAIDINDAGQIVGSGTVASGDTHAFLLTPIPEPSSVAAIFGLMALGVATYRGRRAR